MYLLAEPRSIKSSLYRTLQRRLFLLLRRMRELVQLAGGELSGRQGVGAHELCHIAFLSILSGWFLVAFAMNEIGFEADVPKLSHN